MSATVEVEDESSGVCVSGNSLNDFCIADDGDRFMGKEVMEATKACISFMLWSTELGLVAMLNWSLELLLDRRRSYRNEKVNIVAI